MSETVLRTASVADGTARSHWLECYGAVLEQASVLLSPTDLLVLMPEQGSLAYYLPYLDAALQRWSASDLAQRLLDGARQAALSEMPQER